MPVPIYEKRGHELSERITNIEEFYNSKDYQNATKNICAQVIGREYFLKFKSLIDKISHEEIRNKLSDFYFRIEKNIENADNIAVLTESKKDGEMDWLTKTALKHEWIHVLIDKNNLRPNKWEYNEGLCTYFEYFLNDELNKLEELEREMECNFHKEYYLKGIIFRNLLKDVSDKEKIEKIKDFLRKK